MASVVVNIINYSYVLLALHYLTKESFGSFNTLVAILTMSTVIANPLQLYTTRAISQIQSAQLQSYINKVFSRTALLSVFGLIFIGLISDFVASILNILISDFIMMGVAIVFLLLATISNAISSGLRKLTFQASLSMGSTVIKLLCALLLFKFGLGVTAGVAGYVVGFAITIGITWLASKKWDQLPQINNQAKFGMGAIRMLVLSYLFIAAPFSIDQILAQALNREISGDYAALTIIGKLAFFVSVPFQIVLYSYLSGSINLQQQIKYFWAGLSVAIGTSMLLTTALWVGGSKLTDRLLSPGYSKVAEWIVPFSIGTCGYVFAYAVVSLAIIRNDSRILIPLSIVTMLQISLFLFRHETLAHLVTNQILTLGVLSFGALCYLICLCFNKEVNDEKINV